MKRQASIAERIVVKPTFEQQQTYLLQRCAGIVQELNAMVEQSRIEREELARKITADDGAGELQYQVSWASGIREDIRASRASVLLRVVNQYDEMLHIALGRMARLCRDDAYNRYRGTSSSAFSNAVDGVQREVALQFADWCDVRAEILRDIIAEMTLL